MRLKKPFRKDDESSKQDRRNCDPYSWLENYRRKLSWIKTQPHIEEDLPKELSAEL